MEKKCADCKYLVMDGPCHDQPYPEIYCAKGLFEGVSDIGDIYLDVDCAAFDSSGDRDD